MHKVKFQEQIQIAIAMWSLSTCHSLCRKAIDAGKTIDEINVWVKEIFYFIDERDFEWAYASLKGQPEEKQHLIVARNFFQSLKEMGFKYGKDFTMQTGNYLIMNDKLQNSLNQFNAISSYTQGNVIGDKILGFLLPLSSPVISSCDGAAILSNVQTINSALKVDQQIQFSKELNKNSIQTKNISDISVETLSLTKSQESLASNKSNLYSQTVPNTKLESDSIKSNSELLNSFFLQYILENGSYLKSVSHSCYVTDGPGYISLLFNSITLETPIVKESTYVSKPSLLKISTSISVSEQEEIRNMNETVQKSLSAYNPENGDFIVLAIFDTGDWFSIPVPGNLTRASKDYTKQHHYEFAEVVKILMEDERHNQQKIKRIKTIFNNLNSTNYGEEYQIKLVESLNTSFIEYFLNNNYSDSLAWDYIATGLIVLQNIHIEEKLKISYLEVALALSIKKEKYVLASYITNKGPKLLKEMGNS
ncbi:hypothetical protein [Chlorogloea sp. CCALA 695]|uniref:hypothetical protein n=1 Tax=Chlorogloea sp. CCALA 695 TaxID=2107693 RepID=UPI000D05D763|nr:hypothetical protein [Chlorogloea sp. CCALA 695]PSB28346.1 hypothetical protein C7B70_21035 [Chlorogloea sp. CCALA 695]